MRNESNRFTRRSWQPALFQFRAWQLNVIRWPHAEKIAQSESTMYCCSFPSLPFFPSSFFYPTFHHTITRRFGHVARHEIEYRAFQLIPPFEKLLFSKMLQVVAVCKIIEKFSSWLNSRWIGKLTASFYNNF